MTIESATYINSLDANNPALGDAIPEGDDHIRLIKSVLKATFPSMTAAASAYMTGTVLQLANVAALKAHLALSFELLETETASNSPQLDFTSFNSSLYSQYLFLLDSLLPAIDGTSLLMRHSTDGGSSYLSTGIYSYLTQHSTHALPSNFIGNVGTAQAAINVNVAQSNTVPTYGEITVFAGVTNRSAWRISSPISSTGRALVHGEGGSSASNINALRFLMASGNITSGAIRMYGIRK